MEIGAHALLALESPCGNASANDYDYTNADPVEGGSANDYDYATGDPVNLCDVNGTFVVAIPVAIGVGVGLSYLAGRLAGGPKFPSKEDCKEAKKLLTQYERLFEKVARKPLDRPRKERLDQKRDAGTIRKSDLPGQIQREFPGTLDGLTLSQIADICKYLYKPILMRPSSLHLRVMDSSLAFLCTSHG